MNHSLPHCGGKYTPQLDEQKTPQAAHDERRYLFGFACRGVARDVVETMGIEPTTPCLQSRCSSQLSYVPVRGGQSARQAPSPKTTTVLNRAGLEAAADGSYGAPEAEYARLFGDYRTGAVSVKHAP